MTHAFIIYIIKNIMKTLLGMLILTTISLIVVLDSIEKEDTCICNECKSENCACGKCNCK